VVNGGGDQKGLDPAQPKTKESGGEKCVRPLKGPGENSNATMASDTIDSKKRVTAKKKGERYELQGDGTWVRVERAPTKKVGNEEYDEEPFGLREFTPRHQDEKNKWSPKFQGNTAVKTEVWVQSERRT